MERPEGDAASLIHCQFTVLGCWLRSGPGKVSSTGCALGARGGAAGRGDSNRPCRRGGGRHHDEPRCAGFVSPGIVAGRDDFPDPPPKRMDIALIIIHQCINP